MKKIMAVFVVTFCAFHHCAYADYYRASGGGVYELYVTDCSKAGMHRALENAVADKKAVITKVICDATVKPVKTTPVSTPIELDLNSLPIVELCPCAMIATSCGC